MTKERKKERKASFTSQLLSYSRFLGGCCCSFFLSFFLSFFTFDMTAVFFIHMTFFWRKDLIATILMFLENTVSKYSIMHSYMQESDSVHGFKIKENRDFHFIEVL